MELILLCHAATRAMKTACFPAGDEGVEHDDRTLFNAPEAGRLIVSPARAARETAAWFAKAYDIDPAFDDLDYGRWRGHSVREIGEREPEGVAAWLNDPQARPHDGESIAMLAQRAARAIDRLKLGQDKRCIVVTHAIVVKAAIVHVRGEPLENILRMDLAPLSITSLKLSDPS
jgi:broad specificity phosphatase PhoE